MAAKPKGKVVPLFKKRKRSSPAELERPGDWAYVMNGNRKLGIVQISTEAAPVGGNLGRIVKKPRRKG